MHSLTSVAIIVELMVKSSADIKLSEYAGREGINKDRYRKYSINFRL